MARYDANGISLVLISTDMPCNRVDGKRNATTCNRNAGNSNANIANERDGIALTSKRKAQRERLCFARAKIAKTCKSRVLRRSTPQKRRNVQ